MYVSAGSGEHLSNRVGRPCTYQAGVKEVVQFVVSGQGDELRKARRGSKSQSDIVEPKE